jgi:hypothetical protein
MSSYYDPPEDGPGTVAGPDWYVTTYTMNERDEELVCDLNDRSTKTAQLILKS